MILLLFAGSITALEGQDDMLAPILEGLFP
jgi:hypothetical protein